MNEQIDIFDYIKYFFKKLSIAKTHSQERQKEVERLGEIFSTI